MKGIVTREFTVWCLAERDNGPTCSCWYQTANANSVREAAAEFRSRGWVNDPVNGWRCPGCASKTPEPSNPIAAAQRHTGCK